MKLSDLKPDKRNARKHPEENREMIARSLREVGAARSIVVDENNVVLAGNGVLEAAKEAGIERVEIIPADGKTLYAVQRSGLSEEEKKKLALFDNRTSELAAWNETEFHRLIAEGFNFEGLFDNNALDMILGTVPNFEPVGIDEQGRLDEKAKCKCPECGHEFTP